MVGLEKLNLRMCWKLTGLPERLGDLTGLKMLDLKGCTGIDLAHVRSP